MSLNIPDLYEKVNVYSADGRLAGFVVRRLSASVPQTFFPAENQTEEGINPIAEHVALMEQARAEEL